MLVYSVDGPSMATSFDPIDLDVGITPDAVLEALQNHEYIKALLIALRLNTMSLTMSTWLAIDVKTMEASIIPQLPRKYVVPLLTFLASISGTSNRLGLVLFWLRLLLQTHAQVVKDESSVTEPLLRVLLRNLLPLNANLSTVSLETISLLRVLLFCS
jgi:periodic tryptophan protein 2